MDEATLIKENEKLVYKKCQKFLARANHLGLEAGDIYNTGFIGLIKAVRNFDPENYDVQFATYAVPMIEGEVRRALRDSNPGVKFGRRIKEIAFLISKEELSEEQPESIAKKIGEEISIVKDALHMLKSGIPQSMQQTVFQGDRGDEDISLGEQIGISDDMSAIFVREFIDTLDEKEKKIIELRLQGKMQGEIGKEIGVSQVQISRTLNKLKNKWEMFDNGTEEIKVKQAKGDMNKAKELLKEGNLSVEEIVKETGCNKNTLNVYKYKLQKPKEPQIEKKEAKEPQINTKGPQIKKPSLYQKVDYVVGGKDVASELVSSELEKALEFLKKTDSNNLTFEFSFKVS